MRNEDLVREVEQFLYREARLLDDRRFHEWLTLFTDDISYRMTGRGNRYPRSSKAIAILDPERYVADEAAQDDELNPVYFQNRSFSSLWSRWCLTQRRSAIRHGGWVVRASKAATPPGQAPAGG